MLAKAVASLNTVRRKGKSNVSVVDVAEDDVGSRLGYIEQFSKKKSRLDTKFGQKHASAELVPQVRTKNKFTLRSKVRTKLSKRPNPDTTSKGIIIGPVSIDSRDVSIDIGMVRHHLCQKSTHSRDQIIYGRTG